MTEAVRGRAPSSAEWLSVAAITLVAAAVLTSRISWEGLTSDEAYSYALSQRAFADMLSLFGFEANGAIYSVVLWPLSRIDASESTCDPPRSSPA